MVKRVIYVADDGEEFETEEECLEYEEATTGFAGIVGFDSDMVLQDPAERGADDAFSRSLYFFVSNAEDAKKTFSVLEDYVGAVAPHGEIHDGDVFRYEENDDDWVEMVSEYMNQTKRFASCMASIRLAVDNHAPLDLPALFDKIKQVFSADVWQK